MVENKYKIISLLVFWPAFLIFLACNTRINGYYETMEIFKKHYKKKEIFNHFPNQISNNYKGGFFDGPNAENCFGEIFLVLSYSKKDIESIKKQKFLIIKQFNDEIFLPIKISFVRDSFLKDSTIYSKIQKPFIPIANLSNINFGLGSAPDSIFLPDSKILIPIPNYIVPNDLQVFVIDAQQGDFWEDGCRATRFKKLGKWTNGYSRGFAISENQKLVTFWVVAW